MQTYSIFGIHNCPATSYNYSVLADADILALSIEFFYTFKNPPPEQAG